MFIDPSRIADIEHLQKAIQNPTVPDYDKFRADRALKRIRREMADPKLSAMRERLVLAHRAEDKHAIWQITNQIKDYQKRDRLEEGTM